MRHMPLADRLRLALSFFCCNDALERFRQLGFHQWRADATDMFVSDASLGIDEKALRDPPHAIVDCDFTGIVAPVGIGHVKLLEESAGILFSILKRDPDEDHIFVLNLLPSGFEILSFGAAGHTP